MRIIRRRIVPLCALGILSAVTYLAPHEERSYSTGNLVLLDIASPTEKYKIAIYVEPPEHLCESKLVTKLEGIFENKSRNLNNFLYSCPKY